MVGNFKPSVLTLFFFLSFETIRGSAAPSCPVSFFSLFRFETLDEVWLLEPEETRSGVHSSQASWKENVS